MKKRGGKLAPASHGSEHKDEDGINYTDKTVKKTNKTKQQTALGT